MWAVYCHKHKETGKRYYGITSNLKKRWACCNGKRNHTHGLKWEYVKEL